jgi:AAA15 family ATPase/GTPase
MENSSPEARTMSDETDKQELALEKFKQMLSDLHFRVSDFQDSIEKYLTTIDNMWRDVKSQLATIEARLTGMEVQISAMSVGPQFPIETLNDMLNDLTEVTEDLIKMRERFHAFVEGSLQRVN